MDGPMCTLVLANGQRLMALGAIEEVEAALVAAEVPPFPPFVTFLDEESKDFKVRPRSVIALLIGWHG